MKHAILYLIPVLLLAACDTTEPSQHQPEPVVEAYLVGGEEYPPVRLTLTADIDAIYSSDRLAIRDAAVAIDRLQDNGSAASTVVYAERPDDPGVYEALERAEVETSTRYRLRVELSDGRTVTSETFVPGEFEILRESSSEAVYQGTEQFEVDVTPSDYPGRQAFYVITIESMEPFARNLTPFYLDAIYELTDDDVFDPDTLDVTELEDFYQTSSPPINEASWAEGPGGSIRIRLPWFAVVFYGPTGIGLNAIDDNLNDFIRFQNAQAGGSTLSPGELPNILDSVDGGTGVFGSMARATIQINVLR